MRFNFSLLHCRTKKLIEYKISG